MFFKKKQKKVTWKKVGTSFYIYLNNKEIPGSIPSSWVGSSLLLYLEILNQNYLLRGYENAPDEEMFEAVFVAEGFQILWSKSGDGYYLFNRGVAINEESEPYWIEDLFLVTYKSEGYLLKDYEHAEENVLFPATLVNDSLQVSWVKIKDHFYILAGGRTLDLNHSGHICNDALVIYIDELEAIMQLPKYNRCTNYNFYEAFRIAEKDQYIYRKGVDNGFYLFYNELALHFNTKATYVNDDILAYIPDFNVSLLFPNFRHDSLEHFSTPKFLDDSGTAFWSASNAGFYLIDKGINISPEVSNSNSKIGDHLLLYHPQSTSTYLFENYSNRKDNVLRPAVVISRTAQFVWKAYDNAFWIWHQGKRCGECEQQFMGKDLMVMPKSLKILVQLKDFSNCQDNILRPVE